MSMFHELMMRKKEQIMYATIKGTLTENDGVFSGFSASSYLALQHIIDFSKPFELLFKFTSTDFTNPQYLFSTRYTTTSGFDIYIQNSKIRIWGSTNGTSLDISSYSTDTISVNTTYWYKLKYSPTQIIAELSTDGINFVQENNIALSNQIYQNNYNALIGHGQTANTNYFVGSIDLPNSYIKLGSTKYNLQAVVGYTVVGSPTITDGVVSGFSSANYLRAPDLPNYTKLERFVKFNTGTTTGSTRTIIGNSPYGSINLEATINKVRTTIFVSPNYATMTLNTILLENTTYYYRDILENGTVKGYLYDSNMNLIEEKSSALGYDTGRYFIIGKTTNSERPFTNGSVYLNETYIKVDNKLWFNGQQA